MPDVVREGWYEDPASRHEYRWFSAGAPTDLVRDGAVTSRDALSMASPGLYQSMDLAEPPDTGPLLHTQNDVKPQFELLNFGAGPALVVNTAETTGSTPQGWTERAGAIETVVVLVPFLAGLFLLAVAPVGVALGLMILSPVVAIRQRRKRRASRFQRSASGQKAGP